MYMYALPVVYYTNICKYDVYLYSMYTCTINTYPIPPDIYCYMLIRYMSCYAYRRIAIRGI